MKTKLTTNRPGCGTIGRAMVAATLLLSGILSSAAQKSPVGTWDCVMSGKRDGLALITFSGDGSPGSPFIGFEILVPKFKKPITSTDERGGDTSRSDESGGNGGSTNSAIQFFGSETINGPWEFDSKGRAQGFFIEVSAATTCITNVSVTSVTVTNGDGSTTTTSSTNVTVDCSAMTNTFSFVAKVVPGKRLTLVCSTPFGKVTYKGVPSVALTDISGNWYGIKKGKATGQQTFTEFFTLSSLGGLNNTYDVVGVGPGYSFTGGALYSAQKKLAIVYGTDPSDDLVLSTVGNFNRKTGKGNLKGWFQAAGQSNNHVSYKVTKQ